MKKGPDRKVIIPALLFLPLVAGILLFLALAALADDGQAQGKCAGGPWLESGKHVYAGVYKDLSLMRKLKARSMLFVHAGQLDTVAVAYEYPFAEVFGKMQAGEDTHAFADMLLHGKVAFAKREADTLNLVASPYVFHAWAMDELGGDAKGLEWMEEKSEPGDGSAGEALQAWKAAWDAYSEETQAVGWLAIDAMRKGEIARFATYGSNFVVLSAEETILGLCNKGRVITWDGAKPLPDIDAVAHGRAATR